MRNVSFIIYRANDPYELPVAVLDTVTACSRYVPCSRDEIYDSIKFGDVIHGYKVDVVGLDVDIP